MKIKKESKRLQEVRKWKSAVAKKTSRLKSAAVKLYFNSAAGSAHIPKAA